jgi:hypothetical protein
MKLLKIVLTISLTALVVGCAGTGVRQQVLDAWVGMPVLALDTHSFFKTVYMYSDITKDDIQVRHYVSEKDMAVCLNRRDFKLNQSIISSCSIWALVCDHIFYIDADDWKVIEYAPTGRCYTDETVQPEAPYLRVRGGTYKYQPNYYKD